MLDGVVAAIVVLLVAAGVLIILGPGNVARRIASLRRPDKVAALFDPRRLREVVPSTLYTNAQRVLIGSAGPDTESRDDLFKDEQREIHNAAARTHSYAPAGRTAQPSTFR